MANTPSSGQPDLARDIYAEFRIYPSSWSCPLRALEAEVVDVRQQFVGDRCFADVTIPGSEDSGEGDGTKSIVHTEVELDEDCPCTVFLETECVPWVTAVEEEGVLIETYLPDREVLPDLIDGLEDTADDFELLRLKRAEDVDVDGESDAVTMELADLTDKQREAATLAVAAGYYTSPREASLADLADELGITKSALSQRLNAVESKLARAAFTEG